VSSSPLAFNSGMFELNVRQKSLEEILDYFRKDYAIEIVGLENRNAELLSISVKAESLEIVIKAIFRKLGVKNYAFEFEDQSLRRVSVFQKAKDDKIHTTSPEPERSTPKTIIGVAEILDIVEDSQAQTAGLQIGDFIIAYDGNRIHNARELVQAVENTSEQDRVEITIIRDQMPIRRVLKGGFIGVKIQTKQISGENHGFNFPLE
jgi:PDZ domain-containing secreted protein